MFFYPYLVFIVDDENICLSGLYFPSHSHQIKIIIQAVPWLFIHNPLLLFFLQLPLTEVVEPVDFEEYVSSHAPGVEPGPLRQLMEFPQDDLELLHQDKECITLEPPLPEEEE